MRLNGGASRLVLGATLVALGIAPFGTARADVTIQEKTKFDGLGQGGFMASEGTSTIIISGDRGRVESLSKPTGKIAKRFMGEEGVRSATITRLDRKVIYQVDYHDKSYQEIPFDFMKQNMESMKEALAKQPAEQPGAQEKQEPPPVTCDPIKFEAKKTGEKETIAGLEAGRMTITGNQSCHNTKTQQACNMVYTADNWYAPAGPAVKELQAFMQKQMAAMGFDPADAKKLTAGAQGLLSANTEGLEAVGKEMAKIDGYPVRSRLTIEKGGDCGMMDGEGGEQNPGAAMKDAFKGLFGKKKSESDSSDKGAKKGESASGLKQVFGTTTEVTSITNSGAAADSFEPPEGFKKKEMPKPSEPPKK